MKVAGTWGVRDGSSQMLGRQVCDDNGDVLLHMELLVWICSL